LADWGSLPFWICAEMAKVMKLSSNQPTTKDQIQRSQGRLPPVSLPKNPRIPPPPPESAADALQARLAKPVAQAGPRPVDGVWGLAALLGRFLALRRRSLLAAAAAPSIDGVLGLFPLFGLAFSPG